MDGRATTRRSSIPGPTVDRLPVYHRCLAALTTNGVTTVSSADLSLAVGVNAATLRRDLSRLGTVGTRGTGYDVALLLRGIELALALDREWRIAIVGAGNLGRALIRSRGFSSEGFKVAALFDVDTKVVGTPLDGIVVSAVETIAEIVRRENIQIGVITTPAGAAQDTAIRLCDAGVSTILNFAPAHISLPDSVTVRNVDLGAELQVLAFYGARTPSEIAG